MKTNVLVLIIAIFLTACQKPEIIQDNVTTSELAITAASKGMSDAALYPSNPGNEFDIAGQQHNAILDYIKGCKPVLTAPDVTAITNCVIQYANEQMGVQLPDSIFDSVKQTVEDEANGYVNVIDNIPYSQRVKTSVGAFLNLVRIAGSKKENQYADIKAEIMRYENQVIQDDQFSARERRKLLEVASIARYSVYYWMEVDQRGIDLRNARILSWIAAVTSDIAGGVISGSIGYAADCSEYAFDVVTYSLP